MLALLDGQSDYFTYRRMLLNIPQRYVILIRNENALFRGYASCGFANLLPYIPAFSLLINMTLSYFFSGEIL